jgi:mono/diheme cytochrome c family protein
MRLPVRVLVPCLAAGLLAPLIPSAVSAGNAQEGRKAYELRCQACHGISGAGDGPAALALDPPPRNFTRGVFKFDADKDGVVGTDDDLRLVIKKGAAAFGGNPVMVSWLQLSDSEIADLIAYLRSLGPARTAGD